MFIYFLSLVFIVIAALLMLVILVQRGRGGGLSGAFGMGGGGGTAFGTKTGDVFTWVTVVLFTLFLLMAIGLNFAFRHAKTVQWVAPAPTEVPLTSGAMNVPPADVSSSQPATMRDGNAAPVTGTPMGGTAPIEPGAAAAQPGAATQSK